MAIVSPSILSADFANLEKDMKRIAEAGADWAHVDVMDGHFVPNITIGAPVVKALSKKSDLPLDVHLMISDPDFYLDDFIKAGAYVITIHEECDSDVEKTLKRIREAGVKAALSIKPNTPVSALEKYIDLLDMVLIMTVEPGFGGQSFMPESLPKIRALRAEIERLGLNCDIQVDGGITLETAPLAVEAGANVLVAGTAVFGAANVPERVKEFLDL